MKPRYWAWAFAASLALVFLLLLGKYAVAEAHDWYSGTGCCGGSDCNAIPLNSDWVTPVKQGYHVQLTVEQAMTINPKAKNRVDEIVSWNSNKLKSPPPLKPGQTYGAPAIYHLCIAPSGYVYCLFAVPGL